MENGYTNKKKKNQSNAVATSPFQHLDESYQYQRQQVTEEFRRRQGSGDGIRQLDYQEIGKADKSRGFEKFPLQVQPMLYFMNKGNRQQKLQSPLRNKQYDSADKTKESNIVSKAMSGMQKTQFTKHELMFEHRKKIQNVQMANKALNSQLLMDQPTRNYHFSRLSDNDKSHGSLEDYTQELQKKARKSIVDMYQPPKDAELLLMAAPFKVEARSLSLIDKSLIDIGDQPYTSQETRSISSALFNQTVQQKSQHSKIRLKAPLVQQRNVGSSGSKIYQNYSSSVQRINHKNTTGKLLPPMQKKLRQSFAADRSVNSVTSKILPALQKAPREPTTNQFIDNYFLRPSRKTRFLEQTLLKMQDAKLKKTREHFRKSMNHSVAANQIEGEDSLYDDNLLKQIPMKNININISSNIGNNNQDQQPRYRSIEIVRSDEFLPQETQDRRSSLPENSEEDDLLLPKQTFRETDTQTDIRLSIDTVTLRQMHQAALQGAPQSKSPEHEAPVAEVAQRKTISHMSFQFPHFAANYEEPMVTAYAEKFDKSIHRNSSVNDSNQSISRDTMKSPNSIIMRRSLRHRQKLIQEMYKSGSSGQDFKVSDQEQAVNEKLLRGTQLTLSHKKRGDYNRAYSTVGHLKMLRDSKKLSIAQKKESQKESYFLNRSIRVANLKDSNSNSRNQYEQDTQTVFGATAGYKEPPTSLTIKQFSISSALDRKSPLAVQTLKSADLIEMQLENPQNQHLQQTLNIQTEDQVDLNAATAAVDALAAVSGDDKSPKTKGTKVKKRKESKHVEEKFQQMSNHLIDIMSQSIGEDEEREHQLTIGSEQQKEITEHINSLTKQPRLNQSYNYMPDPQEPNQLATMPLKNQSQLEIRQSFTAIQHTDPDFVRDYHQLNDDKDILDELQNDENIMNNSANEQEFHAQQQQKILNENLVEHDPYQIMEQSPYIVQNTQKKIIHLSNNHNTGINSNSDASKVYTLVQTQTDQSEDYDLNNGEREPTRHISKQERAIRDSSMNQQMTDEETQQTLEQQQIQLPHAIEKPSRMVGIQSQASPSNNDNAATLLQSVQGDDISQGDNINNQQQFPQQISLVVPNKYLYRNAVKPRYGATEDQTLQGQQQHNKISQSMDDLPLEKMEQQMQKVMITIHKNVENISSTASIVDGSDQNIVLNPQLPQPSMKVGDAKMFQSPKTRTKNVVKQSQQHSQSNAAQAAGLKARGVSRPSIQNHKRTVTDGELLIKNGISYNQAAQVPMIIQSVHQGGRIKKQTKSKQQKLEVNIQAEQRSRMNRVAGAAEQHHDDKDKYNSTLKANNSLLQDVKGVTMHLSSFGRSFGANRTLSKETSQQTDLDRGINEMSNTGLIIAQNPRITEATHGTQYTHMTQPENNNFRNKNQQEQNSQQKLAISGKQELLHKQLNQKSSKDFLDNTRNSLNLAVNNKDITDEPNLVTTTKQNRYKPNKETSDHNLQNHYETSNTEFRNIVDQHQQPVDPSTVQLKKWQNNINPYDIEADQTPNGNINVTKWGDQDDIEKIGSDTDDKSPVAKNQDDNNSNMIIMTPYQQNLIHKYSNQKSIIKIRSSEVLSLPKGHVQQVNDDNMIEYILLQEDKEQNKDGNTERQVPPTATIGGQYANQERNIVKRRTENQQQVNKNNINMELQSSQIDQLSVEEGLKPSVLKNIKSEKQIFNDKSTTAQKKNGGITNGADDTRVHIFSKFEDADIYMSRPIPLYTRQSNNVQVQSSHQFSNKGQQIAGEPPESVSEIENLNNNGSRNENAEAAEQQQQLTASYQQEQVKIQTNERQRLLQKDTSTSRYSLRQKSIKMVQERRVNGGLKRRGF